MSELQNIITLTLGTYIIITITLLIITIYLIWLMIKSAVKTGVKEAAFEILKELDITEEIEYTDTPYGLFKNRKNKPQ